MTIDFSRGPFVLQSDLAALQRVLAAEAPEAAVFYAGRILEVLAAQAVEDLGLSPHGTLLANLDLLEQYNLVPMAARYASHALRRLSNDARHILRPIIHADSAVAQLFVTLASEWYFHGYPFGPRVIAAGLPPASARLQGVLSVVSTANPGGLIEASEGIAASSAILSVVAEAMLDHGRPDAGEFIALARARFPEDTRLQILAGLQLSRAGELSAALRILEGLFGKFSHDAEVAGILGGVHKRLWISTHDASQLKRSFETYLAGWKASRETSAYLGTNAAATALWMGRSEFSRELAGGVLALVESRHRRLAARIADPEASMGFWNAATLAELRLLNGDVEGAKGAYGRLFSRHAEKKGNIEVARRQAEMILGGEL